MISKTKLNNLLLFLVFGLTFLGFYVVLVVLVNIGQASVSRMITIPVRALIGICLLALVIFNVTRISFTKVAKVFLWFLFFSITRILWDYYFNEAYYLSTQDLLFYFLSFSIIPFLSITALNLNAPNIATIAKSIIISGTLFSVASFLSFKQFVGEVGRLDSSNANEQVLSPLILSYCATLIIGVFTSYLFYNKASKGYKFVMVMAVILSLIPFFLGASRGSLIALFIPFIIASFVGSSTKNKFLGIIFMLIVVFALISLDSALGSGLFDRFTGTSKAIEENGSSAIRLTIWESSFTQFLDHPFFGDKLRVNNWDIYPHNLFIEVLQSTGIVGFIPFGYLVFYALKCSLGIFKSHRAFIWVPVIFLQALSQNMFSGSIYLAAWFWTSMALLFSTYRYLKLKKNYVASENN